MSNSLSRKGSVALLIASIWTALAAFVVAADAVYAVSTVDLICRILGAIGLMAVTAFGFWLGLEMRRSEVKAGSDVLIPVHVRVVTERRIRRRADQSR